METKTQLTATQKDKIKLFKMMSLQDQFKRLLNYYVQANDKYLYKFLNCSHILVMLEFTVTERVQTKYREYFEELYTRIILSL